MHGHAVPESLEFDLGYCMGKEKKINNQDDARGALIKQAHPMLHRGSRK